MAGLFVGVDPCVLLDGLRYRGMAVRVDGARLLVSPADRLDAETREAVGDAKSALVVLLLNERAWEVCSAKRERFGDTPPDDPRPEARAASDACLSAHAAYMAALGALEAAGGEEAWTPR